jgi:predicted transcriptional regulator
MKIRTKGLLLAGSAALIAGLYDAVFGCRHKHYSFPLEPRRKPNTPLVAAAQVTGKYVTCLECGREFPYDWKHMKVLSPRQARQYTAEINARAIRDRCDPHLVSSSYNNARIL